MLLTIEKSLFNLFDIPEFAFYLIKFLRRNPFLIATFKYHFDSSYEDERSTEMLT